MNDDQWRAVCLHLEEGWKGEMTEQRRGVYATFLKGLEFGVAMKALELLALRGQPWLPTVPELVTAIRQLTSPTEPSWTEVWEQIEGLMAGRLHDVPSEMVLAFVNAEKLERLRAIPFYDPEYGHLRIRDLRARWIEFRERQEARARQAAVLGARRLEQLERGERGTLPPALPAGATSGPGFPE